MPTERVVTTEVIHKYIWPEAQLSFWWFFMWYFETFFLGVFAAFMSIQSTMGLGQPWLFPFSVTIGALGVFFLIVILVLRNNHKLIPNFVLVGSFILFVLNLAALIEEAIELFGPNGANAMCTASNIVADGASVQTLAYLAQSTICNLWQATFALYIISEIFLVWIWVMAWQVSNDNFE